MSRGIIKTIVRKMCKLKIQSCVCRLVAGSSMPEGHRQGALDSVAAVRVRPLSAHPLHAHAQRPLNGGRDARTAAVGLQLAQFDVELTRSFRPEVAPAASSLEVPPLRVEIAVAPAGLVAMLRQGRVQWRCRRAVKRNRRLARALTGPSTPRFTGLEDRTASRRPRKMKGRKLVETLR